VLSRQHLLPGRPQQYAGRRPCTAPIGQSCLDAPIAAGQSPPQTLDHVPYPIALSPSVCVCVCMCVCMCVGVFGVCVFPYVSKFTQKCMYRSHQLSITLIVPSLEDAVPNISSKTGMYKSSIYDSAFNIETIHSWTIWVVHSTPRL